MIRISAAAKFATFIRVSGAPARIANRFGECFAPHLTSFKKIRNGLWAATITEIYKD